jgi:tetratricopeptide (TPR) repeat protein
LQAFQPERDHIKEVLKIDVVSLNSSISSIAKTLQKSGLVRVGEYKRKGYFDMHQLLQRALHENFHATRTLAYLSDGVGFYVMKSLLSLQFGSPFDEICFTRRRLTSIMEILDTAEVVLKHKDFLRLENNAVQAINWREAMLMRLHEISILASSTSSGSTIRLFDTVKIVLSQNVCLMQQQQIQQVQQQQQLLLQEQQLPQLDMLARQQWTSSLLLRLAERETPEDRSKALSTFDGLWNAFSFPHDEMKKRSFLHEWCVYASHLLMLRGDRQFEIDNRKEVYRHKRMGVMIYSSEDLRPFVWWQIEHIKCFQYWQESLNLRVACLGINHPYTARAYHRIARAFLDLDMPHPAIPLLNSAKKILMVSVCDANHFELGSICCDMGRAYELLLPRSDHSEFEVRNHQNRYHDAKWFKAPKVDDVQKQFKDALAFQKASSNTLDVATTWSFYGRFDAYQGNHDKAIESFEKALRIQTDLVAPHHFALHDNRFLLAILHGIKGDLAKADEYYQDAALDRTKYNNMQAWSHLSMVADSFYSECGPMISCLPRDALISILTRTAPNLFRRDECDNDTFVAVPFAENLSSMANTMHDSSKSALSLEHLGRLCSNTFEFLNACRGCSGRGHYFDTTETRPCRTCKGTGKQTSAADVAMVGEHDALDGALVFSAEYDPNLAEGEERLFRAFQQAFSRHKR